MRSSRTINREDALRSLVQRSFDGDQAAYREFLKSLRELLRAYLRRQLFRLGRAECDAEDIVQEVLLAIHTKWHTYDRNMPVTAWVYAIARYKLIDFLRRTTNGSRDLSLDDIEETASIDGAEIDTAISVKTLIAALSDKLRRPIELVRLNGLSVKEASAVTGLSESAVKNNIHRGVKAMARAFGH
jgi:RNA polymerase sigma-70 factor (ECF subfamily)